MTSDMADAHATARARPARASTVTYEVHMCTEGNADFDHVINCPALHTLRTRTHTIDPETGHFTPIDQENPMTAKDRHDELVALLTEIRDRLPKPSVVKFEPFKTANLKPYQDAMKQAAESLAASVAAEPTEPAPADDLPGEPVEPSDLRAGDRVGLTFMGERITCTLVSSPVGDALCSDTPDRNDYYPSVTLGGCEWCPGIFDVRLIERAPRGDVDPDEALARAMWEARYNDDTWGKVDEFWRDGYRRMARAAREHIEAEWKPYILREQTAREKAQDRVAKAEAELAQVRESADEWWDLYNVALNDQTRLTLERDEWKARHKALRADVERLTGAWEAEAACRTGDGLHERVIRRFAEQCRPILARDDERAAAIEAGESDA